MAYSIPKGRATAKPDKDDDDTGERGRVWKIVRALKQGVPSACLNNPLVLRTILRVRW